MIIGIIVGIVFLCVATVFGLRRFELNIPIKTADPSGGSRIYMIDAPGGIIGWLVATFFCQLATRNFGSSMPLINSFLGNQF